MRFFIISLLFLIFFIPPFARENAAPSKKSNPSPQSRSSQVKINAERLIYDEKTNKIYLYDNIKIIYKETILTSKKGVFDTVKKTGEFTDGVKLWQEGSTVTGDRMLIFYNDRKAIIYNNVRTVTYKAVEKSGADKSSPLIITCNKAEFFWEKGEVFAYDNVKAVKGEKRVYGDQGHYSEESRLVKIVGNVVLEQGRRNWMKAPEAIYDISRDTFVAKGGVEAEVETGENKQKPADTTIKDRIITPKIEPVNDEILIPGDEEERQ